MKAKILVKNPNHCTDVELKSFEAMVMEGGEVSPLGLQRRISVAEKLIFIKDTNLAAIGAIKNPMSDYKANVFKKACVSRADKYEFELGWLYVSSVARGKGYGRDLMKTISDTLASNPCFATTRKDNYLMHHLFEQYGFSRLGEPYKSANEEYSLVLYAKS